MGDKIKHKGTTKGDGRSVVYDWYGNEQSGDKELKEGGMDVGDLTCGYGTQIHWQGCCVVGYM